jgi:YD repeat-containing protein
LALSYDANGNIASRTDFNGNRTNYSYDLARNLETSRTEGLTATGASTPATRTIATAWHPSFRLPVQITNGNRQTDYVYNAQGDISQKTVTDTAANTTRSWGAAYTYGTVPGALLKKVEDGPRTDVADLTSYDYYPADAACAGGHLGCRGQLKQITDALGHITHLTRYSANGLPEQLTDANGLVMTLTYDQRQRLASLDTGGETTAYAYRPRRPAHPRHPPRRFLPGLQLRCSPPPDKNPRRPGQHPDLYPGRHGQPDQGRPVRSRRATGA